MTPWVCSCGWQSRQEHTHQEKGSIMNHTVFHDVRGGFFLMVGLATLAFICAVAALSAVMRPARWADRKLVQL